MAPARIHPLALIGSPAEHREHRNRYGFDAQPDGVELGDDVLVEAFVTVDAGVRAPTRVGARTWLMKRAHVGHDCDLGEDNELAPGTTLGGHTTTGVGVRFGVNATTRPFVTIGDRARVGAGAVIITDVPAYETWAGNPARRLYANCPQCDERLEAWTCPEHGNYQSLDGKEQTT